jgi:tetratricopeptide (TPR) repeat protein
MEQEGRVNIATPISAEDFDRGRRKIIGVCLAVLAVLAVIGYFTYRHFMDPIHAREAYDDARRLIGNTRYGQGILACSRAISLKPDFADAYWLRAEANAAQRELDPAESDYTHLIRMEPKAARGYVGRCEIRFENKDYKSAIDDCSNAIQIDPSIARAFNLRGAALHARGEVAQSLNDLNRAVELSPSIDNLVQRGAVLRALGKFKEAIADFDQAAYLFPGNPEVYRARAEAKRAMGDEQGAQEDYTLGKSIEGR